MTTLDFFSDSFGRIRKDGVFGFLIDGGEGRGGWFFLMPIASEPTRCEHQWRQSLVPAIPTLKSTALSITAFTRHRRLNCQEDCQEDCREDHRWGDDLG